MKERTDFLLEHKIALWDVVKSCYIIGSSDSSIKNIIPNDINYIIKNTQIKTIFTTGKTATNLYKKYLYKKTNIPTIYLPSTSSANASWTLEDLVTTYKKEIL